MQLIYLKMLLYSIDKDAVIPFQGVYDSIEEELAEELGEESEMVKETRKWYFSSRSVGAGRIRGNIGRAYA